MLKKDSFIQMVKKINRLRHKVSNILASKVFWGHPKDNLLGSALKPQ